MLYYFITIRFNIIKRGMDMDIFSIVVGVIIGVVVGLFLDVDMFSKKYADEEEKFDAKEEHNEGK